MSYAAKKRLEHKTLADQAMSVSDYSRALFHYRKAAEFTLQLAEEDTGAMRTVLLREATTLVEAAEQVKASVDAAEACGMVGASGVDCAGSVSPKEGLGSTASSPWTLQQRPDVRLEDVAGLKDVKQEIIERIIQPVQNAALFERFRIRTGGGVLMYGPPGTGKTFLGKAVAGELDAPFFYVQPHTIKKPLVGLAESAIHQLFQAARAHERAVIFIDDADELLERRSDAEGHRSVNYVSQFLTELDGVRQHRGILLTLVATNMPWRLDDAVIRNLRLGTHVFVGLPDLAARRAIVALNLDQVPTDPSFDFDIIAGSTEGFSGADLVALCDRAKIHAKNRQLMSNQPEVVTNEDFVAASGEVTANVTAAAVRRFERWRKAWEVGSTSHSPGTASA